MHQCGLSSQGLWTKHAPAVQIAQQEKEPNKLQQNKIIQQN